MDKAIEAAARSYANVAGENPWEDGLRAAIAAYLRNVEASERAKTIGADIIFTDGNPDAVDWNESAGQSFKAMCAAKADELEKRNG